MVKYLQRVPLDVVLQLMHLCHIFFSLLNDISKLISFSFLLFFIDGLLLKSLFVRSKELSIVLLTATNINNECKN